MLLILILKKEKYPYSNEKINKLQLNFYLNNYIFLL